MLEMTDTFIAMKEHSQEVTLHSSEMDSYQICCICNYTKHCDVKCINQARQRMFTAGLRSLENLPPTKNALF